MSERRGRIHEKHDLSKTRRCELLDVPRSSAYYRRESVSEADLAVMRLIDEIHLQLPFYGSRRMRDELEERGHTVNRKRVQRLMRQMDLRALYPRRRTSQPGKGHKIYPYLLRDLSIERANQAWASGHLLHPHGQGVHVPGGDHRTGILDGCWHGGCRTPWIRTSVSRRWRKLYSALKRRRSSIPTKGPSSPVKRSPTCSRTTPLRSAWMARADGWTTCSSNVCGAASSTRTYTCGPTKRPPSFGQDWPATSVSTTPGAVTAHWTDAPPMRCTSTRLTAIWQPETRGRFHLPHCPIPGVHF